MDKKPTKMIHFPSGPNERFFHTLWHSMPTREEINAAVESQMLYKKWDRIDQYEYHSRNGVLAINFKVIETV